jgi:hypothetical protein
MHGESVQVLLVFFLTPASSSGDDGNEMYIVKDGILDVISPDGSTKFDTLRVGRRAAN